MKYIKIYLINLLQLYLGVCSDVSVSQDDNGITPFPSWLTEFTNMTSWPGLDPPYIPLDFIDFTKIPNYLPHLESQCNSSPKDACSFDCDKCLAHDDIATCPKLSQTFDDGPSPATEFLLDHLKHKSTFFTLGYNVVHYPHIYKRITAEGHLLGTHTWSHRFLPSLSNEMIIAQIEWSIWAMNATGNHLPKWFRPPYGGVDERVRAITRQFGLQAVLWEHDSNDWMLLSQSKPEGEIYREVQVWKTRGNRGLILEHDGCQKTVDVALNISDLIGYDQLTVAQCVNGAEYIQQF